MWTLEISSYVLEIPNYAFINTQSRVLHADWLMTRCWKIMRRQLWTLTCPILFSDLLYCCLCSSAALMLHIQQTQIHCTQVYRAVLMKWGVINNVWLMYRKLWRICQTTFKRLVWMERVMWDWVKDIGQVDIKKSLNRTFPFSFRFFLRVWA